jgi:hypothetical protein
MCLYRESILLYWQYSSNTRKNCSSNKTGLDYTADATLDALNRHFGDHVTSNCFPIFWLWMILATVFSQPNLSLLFMVVLEDVDRNNNFILSSETLHSLFQHTSCQFSVYTIMVLHDAGSHTAYVFHWQFNLPSSKSFFYIKHVKKYMHFKLKHPFGYSPVHKTKVIIVISLLN